ncbi:MAG TPA: aminotransferase class V-fold PLP-dependent enzyme [Actinomycetota bacterium]|nr:aminotransferase class V-fold PLP-dependent enzyme [Actinomycetota bacterium]
MTGSLAPRDDFPILERVTYLNTASISLTPMPVRREIDEFEHGVVSLGTINLDDAAEARVYDGVRDTAASLLGCAPTDVAVVTSATEALCQVAWWLRPGEGANVVSVDLEFPSVTYPWLRLAQDLGTDVRLVRALDDPASLSLDAVARAVDERTEVLCISHVQYATGHRLDPAALAELAHAHDALLVLDATQSAGVVPLEVRATDQDIVIGSSYKWLTGTPGAGFCYLRPEVAERFSPPLVGWRTTGSGGMSFDATEITLAAGGRRMEYATVAYGSGIGLGAGIRYLLGVGIGDILEHVLGLGDALIRGLRDLGAELVTPEAREGRAGIVAARFPGRRAEALAARLAARGVHVAPRLGALRFSPHLYNDERDVATALDELSGALAEAD